MGLQNTVEIDRSKAKLQTFSASLFKNRAVIDVMRSSMLRILNKDKPEQFGNIC